MQTSIKTDPVSVGVSQGFEQSKKVETKIIADFKAMPLEELEDAYGTYQISGLSGYFSQVDKCDYIWTNGTNGSQRTVFRKRHLFLRDYNKETEALEG